MSDSPKNKPDPIDKSLGDQATGSEVSRQAWKKRLAAHRKKSLGEQSTRRNPRSSRSDLSDLRPENKPASIDKSRGDQATGPDVFLSHSTQNKTVADAVCATLERRGIRCWVAPRDIPGGENWGSGDYRRNQQIEGDGRDFLLGLEPLTPGDAGSGTGCEQANPHHSTANRRYPTF